MFFFHRKYLVSACYRFLLHPGIQVTLLATGWFAILHPIERLFYGQQSFTP